MSKLQKLNKVETFEGIGEYLLHHCNEPLDLVQYLCSHSEEEIYNDWEEFIRSQAEILLPLD